MIIASRLVDGVVVFFSAAGVWAEAIDAGLVVESEEDVERNLALAKADEQQCLVIDPYLIDIETAAGRRRPTSIREAIRAFGPTVRTDLMPLS